MNQETKEALRQFFSAQKKLNQLGIIRSRDYVGDIAKYLCTLMYGLEPVKGRATYDGKIGRSRITIRFNNCPTGHRVTLDEPVEYDEAIVVLGPNCWLRPENVQAEFIFYRFAKEEVLREFESRGGRYVGGKSTFSQRYDKILTLTPAAPDNEAGQDSVPKSVGE